MKWSMSPRKWSGLVSRCRCSSAARRLPPHTPRSRSRSITPDRWFTCSMPRVRCRSPRRCSRKTSATPSRRKTAKNNRSSATTSSADRKRKPSLSPRHAPQDRSSTGLTTRRRCRRSPARGRSKARRLRELAKFIDWTPFFHAWELRGVWDRENKVLKTKNAEGAVEAGKLYQDAMAWVDRIIAEDRFRRKASTDFSPRMPRATTSSSGPMRRGRPSACVSTASASSSRRTPESRTSRWPTGWRHERRSPVAANGPVISQPRKIHRPQRQGASPALASGWSHLCSHVPARRFTPAIRHH